MELVASIEAAAQSYIERIDPRAAFKEWHGGDIYRMCSDAGGESHANEMADRLGPTVGSRFKYRRFISDNFPAEPPSRPPDNEIGDWTMANLWPYLDDVYARRSSRLHDAVPFPMFMLMPPMYAGAGNSKAIPVEVMRGTAQGHGVTATTSYLQLHVFEYVTRHAVLNWLTSRLETQNQADNGNKQ